MREILFRGKRVDNGEWVEGYYVYDECGQVTEEPTAYIYHLNQHPCGWDLIPYEVIPESISESTGLTDKNGKKIFEGDIIRDNHNLAWFVAYERHAFVCKDDEMETYFTLREQWEYDCKTEEYLSPSEEFEIIGNIHDNPELLKGGAE